MKSCNIPVKWRRVAGHEKEDVCLRRAGDVADITKSLETGHDVKRASLVDQAGVQSCSQVAH